MEGLAFKMDDIGQNFQLSEKATCSITSTGHVVLNKGRVVRLDTQESMVFSAWLMRMTPILRKIAERQKGQ